MFTFEDVAARVTMKDVAVRAGVDRSTVSLSLRNSPRIADSTKERVLAAARDLGYRPHPYLTTLMHSRRRGKIGKSSETLAIVMFSSPGDHWKQWEPEFRMAIDEARRQAQARGYFLEEFEAPLDKTSPQRLGDILFARGIKGVIVGPIRQPSPTLDWQWERFAVVALGSSLYEARVHRVRHDYFQAMITAMEECYRLGYRRIGLVLKEDVNRKVEQRWLGSYLLKQKELGVEYPLRPLVFGEWSQEDFRRWIEENRPEVIVGTGPLQAAMGRAGFRIPEDVGLVSLSAAEEGERSGISQDWGTQGKRAVSMLVSLLEENLFGLHEHPLLWLVNGSWNRGRTVGRKLEVRS